MMCEGQKFKTVLFVGLVFGFVGVLFFVFSFP